MIARRLPAQLFHHLYLIYEFILIITDYKLITLHAYMIRCVISPSLSVMVVTYYICVQMTSIQIEDLQQVEVALVGIARTEDEEAEQQQGEAILISRITVQLHNNNNRILTITALHSLLLHHNNIDNNNNVTLRHLMLGAS